MLSGNIAVCDLTAGEALREHDLRNRVAQLGERNFDKRGGRKWATAHGSYGGRCRARQELGCCNNHGDTGLTNHSAVMQSKVFCGKSVRTGLAMNIYVFMLFQQSMLFRPSVSRRQTPRCHQSLWTYSPVSHQNRPQPCKGWHWYLDKTEPFKRHRCLYVEHWREGVT